MATGEDKQESELKELSNVDLLRGIKDAESGSISIENLITQMGKIGLFVVRYVESNSIDLNNPPSGIYIGYGYGIERGFPDDTNRNFISINSKDASSQFLIMQNGLKFHFRSKGVAGWNAWSSISFT